MKTQPVRVLYAEDNPFERDNFISALEKCNREGCNFNVIVVETGKAAKEELMKPEIHFDLALLNDLMPDMNGEEILHFIKQSPDHKHIPVIMMIAGTLEDRGLLDLADDIYYKPIRINHIRNFTNFLNNIKVTRECGKAFWDCYNKLEHIADGTYGPIGTGCNKKTKGIVAIKVISLKELSPYEKDIFSTQVETAKFKKAPTTIQIEDIFMDNEYVHIVMEYVGPTLSKEIQRCKAQKQKISNQQILDWIAHLVIGLLWTHSEDGVQQDISTEKILLDSNNIAKLRPYEVYSSLICSQTKLPYTIPPEVLKGGKCSKESDIWALGCVIYEMTALRKPFDSNSIPELIREICEDKPDLLPEDVDPIIRMLVSSMLQKDPAKRPSIWDIAEVDAIEKRILKLIDEHNCQKSLELFLNLEKRIHKIKLVDYWSERKPIIEGSEYLAQTIRNSIQFRTVNLGFLKTEEKVLTGEDLFNWFKKQLRIFDFHEIKTAINRMIHEGILVQLNEEQEIEFKNCSKVYYRFLVDNHGSSLNMLRLYHEKVHDPLALTIDLVKKMNDVLEEIQEDPLILETEQPHIDFQMLGDSKAYMDFNKSICALQSVSFENIEQKKIKACFLNIYQIMLAHQFLLQTFQCSPPKNVLSQVLNILRNSEERVFFYRISTMNFTVEDIFHSLFRVNKKARESILSRVFRTSDPRYQILQLADDPRVLFVLLPNSFVLRKLKVFNCENLEEELDNCCKTYLREKIIYDPYENEIYLPEILRTYKNYFGKQKDIENFIFKYSKFEVNFDGDLNVIYQ